MESKNELKLNKQAAYHLVKLQETVSQTLGLSYAEDVLVTRSLQHYRIVYMMQASKMLSLPPSQRKIHLAKFIEAEVDRLNQIKAELAALGN